jgi:hypothetical protein
MRIVSAREDTEVVPYAIGGSYMVFVFGVLAAVLILMMSKPVAASSKNHKQ